MIIIIVIINTIKVKIRYQKNKMYTNEQLKYLTKKKTYPTDISSN